jgi:hypothetical protein
VYVKYDVPLKGVVTSAVVSFHASLFLVHEPCLDGLADSSGALCHRKRPYQKSRVHRLERGSASHKASDKLDLLTCEHHLVLSLRLFDIQWHNSSIRFQALSSLFGDIVQVLLDVRTPTNRPGVRCNRREGGEGISALLNISICESVDPQCLLFLTKAPLARITATCAGFRSLAYEMKSSLTSPRRASASCRQKLSMHTYPWEAHPSFVRSTPWRPL